MDKLFAMQAFVTVVTAGGFTAAARRLGRSKARISQSVAALESELGVVLLQRTTRSSSLTEAGRAYFDRCEALLAEIDALEASVKEERAALEGLLRVTAPPGLADRYLAALTTDFHVAHPGVVIELDLTHRLVDLVEGGIDVAIRVTEPQDSSLIARKLAPAPIVAVAAPAYLKRRGQPRTPSDLREHDCLVDTNFRDQPRWRFWGSRKPLSLAVRGPFRANSPVAVRDLAVAGHGIALCPHFVVQDEIAAGRLVEVLTNTVALSWSIYAVYPRRDHLPTRVTAYLEHLARAFGPTGAGRAEPTPN